MGAVCGCAAWSLLRSYNSTDNQVEDYALALQKDTTAQASILKTRTSWLSQREAKCLDLVLQGYLALLIAD